MRYWRATGRKAAQRVEIDGIKFQSKAEGNEYLILLAMLRSGVIAGLKVHPRFSLDSPEGHVCYFSPDFYYTRDGQPVVHEVKGFREEDYKLKRRWFESQYPEIEFIEVRAHVCKNR